MAFDDARQFLAQVVPWPLQGEYYVDIVAAWPKDEAKPRVPENLLWGGQAFTGMRGAVRYMGWAVENRRDIYVCMSGQRLAKAVTDPKTGKVRLKAMRHRHDAVLLKSFYLDADVKEGAYPNAKAALSAVGHFCDTVGLPHPSFVVLSGRGLHVYWTLHDPITPAVWQPIADKLAAAIRHVGLHADTQCTVNSAQILRVPETFNHKADPPLPVRLLHAGNNYDLERIERTLMLFCQQNNIDISRTSPRTYNVVSDEWKLGPLPPNAPPFVELVANQERYLPTLVQLGKCCPFIEQAVLTGGAGYPQGLWKACAHVAFYTAGQHISLRNMSTGYAGYDEAECDRLFERIKNERTPEDRFGWPLCSTIENEGARECRTCPWKQAGRTENKSPFHFLNEDHRKQSQPSPPSATEPVTDYGPLPHEYYRSVDGTIWRDFEVEENGTKKTVPTQICSYPIKGLKVIHDDGTGTERTYKILFESVVDHRGWLPMVIKTITLHDPRAFGKALNEQFLVMQTPQRKMLEGMLTSFAEQLRLRKDKSLAPEPLGWSLAPDGLNGEAFVYGGWRRNCKGDTPALILNAAIANQYTPRGELEMWKRAMKLINNLHRPALEAIVAASFGSVFVNFTDERGMTICAYSSASGVFKTSTMRVGQTVWGSPRGMQKVDASVISTNSRLGHLRHLPVFWDEVHSQEATVDLAKAIFSLTQGSSRQRAARDGELRDVNEWATLMITATNWSLLDLADDYAKTTAAGLYRVFEFSVPESSDTTGITDEASVILLATNNNYGVGGDIVARWCGHNAASMLDIVQQTRRDLVKEVHGSHAERFWIAAMTCMLLGASVANKLKLADFDVPALKMFLIKNFDKLRNYRDNSGSDIERTANVKEILSGFINQNRRSLLITDIVPTGVGRPPIVTIINPADMLTAPKLVAQWAQKDKVLRVNQNEFEEYLRHKHFGKHTILEMMKRKFGMKETRARIGGGTKAAKTATAQLLEFNLLHDDLQGFLEEVSHGN